MPKVILQSPATFETRTAAGACMMSEKWSLKHSPIDKLDSCEPSLRSGAMPVGDMHFVKKAMTLAGISHPSGVVYPKRALKHLKRDIEKRLAGEVLGPCLVSPAAKEIFPTFFFDPVVWTNSPEMELFEKAPYDTEVWTSDAEHWACEWRYYVLNGEVIGSARYDKSRAKNAPTPNIEAVMDCIFDLKITHPYALDMGVSSSGETGLIGTSDAYSARLYPDSLSPQDYLKFLKTRWAILLKNRPAK